jgi:hypothetical protein
MRRTIKVRGRNGVIREEVEGYLLSDGEAMFIPLSFMDSKPPSMITDSRGSPAGQRPGFLYADSNQQALDAAHRDYRTDIEARWQSDRWQDQKRSNAAHLPGDQKRDNVAHLPRDAGGVDAAYRQYAADISERWRR